MWNIAREIGRAAEVIQSIEIQTVMPHKIFDLAVTFDEGKLTISSFLSPLLLIDRFLGKYLAVLSDRVYFLNNDSITISSGCPVPEGIILCPLTDEFVVVFPLSVSIIDIKSGAIKRSLSLSECDRDCLTSADYITCAAADHLGKKVFLGTNQGLVSLFDATSFGLLRYWKHTVTSQMISCSIFSL